MSESTSSPRRIVAKEKAAKAIELRKAGKSFQAIADELGYGSDSAAFKAVQRALKAIAGEPAEELRTLELQRLDDLNASLWTMALGKEWVVRTTLVEGTVQNVMEPDPDSPGQTRPVLDLVPASAEDQARAVQRVVNIMERRAKLLGLDAPTKQDVYDKREVEAFQAAVLGALDALDPADREKVLARIRAAVPA